MKTMECDITFPVVTDFGGSEFVNMHTVRWKHDATGYCTWKELREQVINMASAYYVDVYGTEPETVTITNEKITYSTKE